MRSAAHRYLRRFGTLELQIAESMENSGEHDKELLEFLLLAAPCESNIQPIAALASKAAALFETDVSNQQQMGDYSVRPADPVTPVWASFSLDILQFSSRRRKSRS
jgi:hypothetical protein